MSADTSVVCVSCVSADASVVCRRMHLSVSVVCQPMHWQDQICYLTNNFCCLSSVEVQSPSLGVPADPSQVDQPDQLHIWCLQLDIFFDKFFQAADTLEMVKQAQANKS